LRPLFVRAVWQNSSQSGRKRPHAKQDSGVVVHSALREVFVASTYPAPSRAAERHRRSCSVARQRQAREVLGVGRVPPAEAGGYGSSVRHGGPVPVARHRGTCLTSGALSGPYDFARGAPGSSAPGSGPTNEVIRGISGRLTAARCGGAMMFAPRQTAAWIPSGRDVRDEQGTPRRSRRRSGTVGGCRAGSMEPGPLSVRNRESGPGQASRVGWYGTGQATRAGRTEAGPERRRETSAP